MIHLRDLIQARRERRERLREIAFIPSEDIAAYGLSREEFTALAVMPSEQFARMEAMANLNGCPTERLERDRDLRVAVALTCAACGSQSRCRSTLQGAAATGTDFCPNAGTYRMLAAE